MSMKELKKNPTDHDLDFLHSCTKDELEPIVAELQGKDDDGNIDWKGRNTSELQKTVNFIAFFPDHTHYVDEIIAELERFGSNGIATAVRGYGVPYREVLQDVCGEFKLKDLSESVEECECRLLEAVMNIAWDKMDADARRKLLDALKLPDSIPQGATIGKAVIQGLMMGGAVACQISAVVTSLIASVLVGHGVALGGSVVAGRAIGFLMGPVVAALAGLWLLADLAGPAFRVTIPSCIYIAALRQMKKYERAR
jgi:uncharacterized protein YaaW (UPF0174 family)